jgi:hypothetical protein
LLVALPREALAIRLRPPEEMSMNDRIQPGDDSAPSRQEPGLRGGTPPGSATQRPEPLSPNEARQGQRGSPVFMVLVGGLLLAMVAWGAAEWWGQSTEPPAEQTATPPAGNTTPVNPDTQPSSTP